MLSSLVLKEFSAVERDASTSELLKFSS